MIYILYCFYYNPFRGSAQVRSLKDFMLSRFGVDKLRAGDYLNSVSQGLAWSYYN